MIFTKYLVLGSNSFAGTCLVEKILADGGLVLAISRSPNSSDRFRVVKLSDEYPIQYTFQQADLNNDFELVCDLIKIFKPNVIIDFSGQGMVAESWLMPEQWYRTNILTKVKLHNFLKNLDFLDRYVRVSTPEVYGNQTEASLESWIYNPTTPYAVSHAAIDMSLRAFHQQYDFPVIFTRFANFYGPSQQLYRIIPRAIICSLLGKKLKLHGGGTSVRAFVYGLDVAEGIMKAIDFGVIGDCYHFSSKRFLSIREAIDVVCNVIGVKFENLIEFAPERPGKDYAYLMDSSKSRRELGWEESISFEDGVIKTAEWVKCFLPQIKSMPLEYIHKE